MIQVEYFAHIIWRKPINTTLLYGECCWRLIPWLGDGTNSPIADNAAPEIKIQCPHSDSGMRDGDDNLIRIIDVFIYSGRVWRNHHNLNTYWVLCFSDNRHDHP